MPRIASTGATNAGGAMSTSTSMSEESGRPRTAAQLLLIDRVADVSNFSGTKLGVAMTADIDQQPLVLAVDASEVRLAFLEDALKDAGFERVHLLSDTSDILNKVIEIAPDVILIEVQSPGRDTLEQLTLIRDQQPTAVVLITQDEEAQTIKSAVDSGVCAYTAGGIQATKVRPVIEIAMATFQKFKRLRGELAQARDELSQHKRIDRAKALLMQERGLSEKEAHQALRKLSMDRKRKLADVADDLLAISRLLRE